MMNPAKVLIQISPHDRVVLRSLEPVCTVSGSTSFSSISWHDRRAPGFGAFRRRGRRHDVRTGWGARSFEREQNFETHYRSVQGKYRQDKNASFVRLPPGGDPGGEVSLGVPIVDRQEDKARRQGKWGGRPRAVNAKSRLFWGGK